VSEEPFDGDAEDRVRINDRRVIDPETLQARQPARPAAAPAGGTPAQAEAVPEGAVPDAAAVEAVEAANQRAEEATADAKRIAAEYANYRRRVDRDRDLQREAAIGAVIAELLPVLDDIGRARSHDELSGGFKSVGEAVEAVAQKYGLEAFGEEGEAFDPAVHEAMTSEPSDEVSEPTVAVVYQVGYRLGGRLLRPARVGVADTP